MTKAKARALVEALRQEIGIAESDLESLRWELDRAEDELEAIEAEEPAARASIDELAECRADPRQIGLPL